MEKISLLVFIFYLHHTNGFYRLTAEEFASMPPLVNVDRFSHCVDKPGGIYCTTHANVVADRHNPIYDMMVNYTNSAARHYNYTKLLYGVCLTDNCKDHLKGTSDPELKVTSEACLNETFKEKYDFGVKVEKLNCYKYKETKYKVDYIDTIVLCVIIGILAVNVLATVYDVIFQKEDEEGYFLSFSFRGNWRKLMAPPPSDPRKSQLVGINGIRVISQIMVILGHAPMPLFMAIENPQWLENAFLDAGMQVLFQGSIITQTFFLISGMFLTYNTQILSETRKLTGYMLPKGIFLRWLRLSPVNILIVTLSATFFRFSSYGPFWQENIGVEVNDCRSHWMSVVFFYSNYVDESVCSLQNWSMATDMHLHIIGLAIVILSPTVKARNHALLVFFIVSLVAPALEVYFRELDGTNLTVAHAVRTYMTEIPTFQHLYQRTHTNMPCFVMGMYLGYYIYDLQRNPNLISEKTKNLLSYVYWTLFPWMVVVTGLTFPLFLGDGPRAPVWIHVLFSMTQKPAFGFLVALIIIGLVIRVEETPLYSWVLESKIWVPLSKLTYGWFATHVIIVRYLGGTRATLSYISTLHILHDYTGVVILSIVTGFFLYMLVEAPFGQLFKLIFISGPKSSGKVSRKDIHENGVHKNGKANGYSITNGGTFTENGKPIKAE